MSPVRRLWNIVRRARMNEDLRQEFETHLALIEEEERAKGLSAEQARDQTRARFGNSLAYRERALDAVIATWLENTCKEMIFAARRLGWSPAFTLATGLTLAIGANAAIFTVVYRVLSPKRISGIRATPSLAAVLRVAPTLGRWFHWKRGPGASPVAVAQMGGVTALHAGCVTSLPTALALVFRAL